MQRRNRRNCLRVRNIDHSGKLTRSKLAILNLIKYNKFEQYSFKGKLMKEHYTIVITTNRARCLRR